MTTDPIVGQACGLGIGSCPCGYLCGIGGRCELADFHPPCGGDGGTVSDGGTLAACGFPPAVGSTQCSAGDIASYCSTTSCGSYSDELSSLRQADSCASSPGKYGVVRIGTCGALRFIEVQGLGLGSKLVRFYDSQDKIVFAQVASDTTEYCNGSAFAENYGAMSDSCALVSTETVCHNDTWIC